MCVMYVLSVTVAGKLEKNPLLSPRWLIVTVVFIFAAVARIVTFNRSVFTFVQRFILALENGVRLF